MGTFAQLYRMVSEKANSCRKLRRFEGVGWRIHSDLADDAVGGRDSKSPINSVMSYSVWL